MSTLPKPVVQVFAMSDRAVEPTRGADETDAGFDISIVDCKSRTLDAPTTSPALEARAPQAMVFGLFHTHLVVVFNDPMYYGELHARSSLHKSGLCLPNGVGIIDPSYRGELLVALAPLPGFHPVLTAGGIGYPTRPSRAVSYPARVAQLIIKQRSFLGTLKLEEKLWQDAAAYDQSLALTDRGAGGFGSTNTKVEPK